MAKYGKGGSQLAMPMAKGSQLAMTKYGKGGSQLSMPTYGKYILGNNYA